MLKVVHTICIPFGIENVWLCIGAHTLSEGAIEGLQGGNMFHGFIMGAVSGAGGYAINNYGQELGRAGKIASSAVLGGVVSEIGGGKFAKVNRGRHLFTINYNHGKKLYKIRLIP